MALKTTWVLVSDGARAQFYVSDGHSLAPALDHTLAAPTRSHAREAESDRPGRSFDSAGQGRHAMEPPTDWKTHEKDALARAVAEELRHAANRRDFDRLVVVASPEMLGDLRDCFDKVVAQRVVAEIAKDLTHLDARELPSHLGDALRPGLH